MVASGSLDQVSAYVAQAQNSAQNSPAAAPSVPVVPSTFPEDTVTISSAAQNMVQALNASGEPPDLIAAQLNLPVQSVEDSLSFAATA
jgi:hypothetical protein